MKRSFFAVALAVAGAVLPIPTAAVPTKLSADAGEVRDILYHSGSGNSARLYAATQGGGVYISQNGGQTWEQAGTTAAMNSAYVWKIAASPLNIQRIYAATDSGVFRSDNSGGTWTQLTFDPARAVAVDPGSSGNDRVLIGVTGGGIYRSTDNGATWTRQSTGLDSLDVTHIIFQAAGIAYAVLNCNSEDGIVPFGQGNWGGVFRTTNATLATIAWVNYNNGGSGASLPTKCVRAIAANAGRLFVGTQDPFNPSGGVYRSDGGGWTAPGAGNPITGDFFGVESLSIGVNSSTNIIVGSRAIGVWSSTDNGVTWSQKSDPEPANSPDVWTRIYATATVSGNATRALVAAKGLGIMRTDTFTSAPGSAVIWDVAPGLRADRVRALDNHRLALNSRFWMGLEGGGVVRSDNFGSTWTQEFLGLDFGLAGFPDILVTVSSIAADPSSTSTVVIGTRGGGLLQWDTVANPDRWTKTGLPAALVHNFGDHKPLSLAIPVSGTVYSTFFDGAGGLPAGGLWKSTTGPNNLAQRNYPGDLLSCASASPVQGGSTKLVQTSGNRAYLLRHDALPYRSTDNFESNAATCVTAPSVGYERLTFYDLAEKPTNTAVLVAATSKGVFRSTDSGANWARVDVSGLASQVLSSVGYIASGILYAVERGGRLYCSTNDGTTWQQMSLGTLAPVSFREIRILNGTLHILTDGGGVYSGFAATCP